MRSDIVEMCTAESSRVEMRASSVTPVYLCWMLNNYDNLLPVMAVVAAEAGCVDACKDE
jgi:hypothetical protein